MPVNRLLISMSLPMIISMLVQALYNIIDSVFVAQISEAALAAVSMAFPVQSLMIAVSTGTCVGVNALLSRSLGEGKVKDVKIPVPTAGGLCRIEAKLCKENSVKHSHLPKRPLYHPTYWMPDLQTIYHHTQL